MSKHFDGRPWISSTEAIEHIFHTKTLADEMPALEKKFDEALRHLAPNHPALSSQRQEQRQKTLALLRAGKNGGNVDLEQLRQAFATLAAVEDNEPLADTLKFLPRLLEDFWQAATAALQDRLIRSHIHARRHEDDRRPIDPLLWTCVAITAVGGTVPLSRFDPAGDACWLAVFEVKSDDILRIWPMPVSPPSALGVPPAQSEAAVVTEHADAELPAAKRRVRDLVSAVERRLAAGRVPPGDETWAEFHVAIVDELDAWRDRKNNKTKQGFGFMTIKRDVEHILGRTKETN